MTCPACGAQDVPLDVLDGALMCEDCLSQPLMPRHPWSVDSAAYRALETCESCDQCGDLVNVPGGEGIHTHDCYVLCYGCALDGMPRRLWDRLRTPC